MSQVQKNCAFNFFSLSLFSFHVVVLTKMNTGREFLADRRQNQLSEHLWYIFFLSSFLCKSVFLDSFWWWSWTRSRIGWVLEVGRSAPSLSLSVVAVARRQQPNVAAHLELHPRFWLAGAPAELRSAFHALGPSLPLDRQCHYLHINIDQVPSNRDREKLRLVVEDRSNSCVYFGFGD